MHKHAWKAFALAPALTFIVPSGAIASPVLYTQAYDGSGNAEASQEDISSAGLGNFATVYDNFRIAGTGADSITNLSFTGGYFNPAGMGSTKGFDIAIYSNDAGQPGSLLWSGTSAGTNNESCGRPSGSSLICTYDIGLNFVADSGVEYWLSIVDVSPLLPQWGWATGTGGDGLAYQDFFGTRSAVHNDLAFSLDGSQALPEPSTWAMLMIGFCAAGMVLRRLNARQVEAVA